MFCVFGCLFVCLFVYLFVVCVVCCFYLCFQLSSWPFPGHPGTINNMNLSSFEGLLNVFEDPLEPPGLSNVVKRQGRKQTRNYRQYLLICFCSFVSPCVLEQFLILDMKRHARE